MATANENGKSINISNERKNNNNNNNDNNFARAAQFLNISWHTNSSTNRKLYKFVLLCGQVDHMNPGRIL